jgi:hypothetical protein
MGRDRLRLAADEFAWTVKDGGARSGRLEGVAGVVGAGLAEPGSVREFLARALFSLGCAS